MITEKEITPAGEFVKTHGIHGELNASISVNEEFLRLYPMFICLMDGIYVPFFIEEMRPRGARAVLIRPHDVNSETEAKLFAGKTIYILKRDLLDYEERFDADEDHGAYADDLIGYSVDDARAGHLGVITSIEDSTANMLFILRTPEDKTLYIPVAEPFITSINHDDKTLGTDLPDGLVNLKH